MALLPVAIVPLDELRTTTATRRAMVRANAISSAAVRLKMLLRFILAEVRNEYRSNHRRRKVANYKCNGGGNVRFHSAVVAQLVG